MMIQYNTGITSTLKKDKQNHSAAINVKNKKIQERFKLKSPKNPNFLKENALFNQTSGSKRFIALEESCHKLPQEPKIKKNIENSSKKALKVSNTYLNEHLINGIKRKSVKMQTIGKSQQIEKLKPTKNLQISNKTSQKLFNGVKELNSTEQISNNVPEKPFIDSQFTGKQLDEKKKLYQNQYKQQKEQPKPKLKLGNRIRPKRSLSSSSGQSKNSYYGIVAEYRKRRLQSQDSIGKNFLENSVSLSGSGHGHNLINRAKSYSIIKLSGSLNEAQINVQKNSQRKFQWKRPRIGTSASSQESIKSSQSNLSSSTKNPFEQKVILMRQHLKLRKGKTSMSNEKLNPVFVANKIENPLQNFIQGQSYLMESHAQYRQEPPQVNSQTKKYKELYEMSLQKVKNVQKQLQIQKRKNELTKNIFKAQINKLKRTKSFEIFNEQEKPQRTKSRVFERIDTAQGDYPKGIRMNCNINQRQNSTNTINELKDKLKNSHLFSYPEYPGVTVNSNRPAKASSLYQKQNQSQSILIPSEELLTIDNTSNDMIVEMSSEWRESGLFGSSFVKSKLAHSRQNQNNHQFQTNGNVQFSFKKIDYCRNDSMKNKSIDQVKDYSIDDQSMLLDISSNLNQTKTSKNIIEPNNSQHDFLNLLEPEELVQSQIIIVQSKNNSTPKPMINQIKFQDYQKPQPKNMPIQPKAELRYPKSPHSRKDFAEDLTKKLSGTLYESEYDSTQSSTGMKTRYNLHSNKYFPYQ